MPQSFRPDDRDQELLLPSSLRDWLPADHFAWFLLDSVKELELSAFYGSYRADGHGRAAYDPSMMVGVGALGLRDERALGARDRAPLL